MRSRRWRVVAVVAIAGTAVDVLAWSLSSKPMTQTIRPVAKPFALGGWAGEAATTVSWIGWAVLFASVPAAALCAVLRFRASRGVERQQLRWVVAGAAAAAAGPLLLIPLGVLGLVPPDTFALPMLLSVPVAIAVAVLRYRLWDLDRLVSRTVTYALVTALLRHPLPAGRPHRLQTGRRLGQPGRGRRHPDRGRPVPAPAPPGPAAGRPPLQPPPL